jgi:HSP20 family protein
MPQIEVFERENQFVIGADLPGVKKDDLNIEVTNDMLTISGERRDERDENREGYRHSERRYGRFYRSIPLPEGVTADNVQANYQHGVLEITMPKPQREQRGRRIEIQESSRT